MTIDQVIVFAVIAGLMVLFISEKIRYDLAALLGLLAAVGTGIVPVDKAFGGFGDQVVIIVASALIISAGVSKSGVIARLIRRGEPYMRTPGTQVFVLATSVALLSSFMKNIGALAIFLPVALQIARRSGTSASTLLMPMAFASLIGGVVTLVGTSPNILVSRIRQEVLGKPFEMFDFAPVGLGILVAGLGFLAFGWRLLPASRGAQASAQDAFQVDAYIIEASVPASSPFVDKTVESLEALGDGEVSVTAIIREGGRRYIPSGHWWIFADDVLVLQGDAHAVRELAQEARLDVVGTAKTPDETLAPAQISVVEAVVMADSQLVGRTPSDLRLRDRFGVNLLGISRPGQAGNARLGRTPFRVGDVVILQGSTVGTPDILRDLGCLPLTDRATGFGSSRRDYLPLVILAIAIVLIAAKFVPVTAAFFGAAVLIVLLHVLTLGEAYRALDPPILVLLACLIPISDAVSSTGAAGIAAGALSAVAGELSATGTVALVLVATMAMTPFLNNAATVLIMAPIAVGVARNLDLNPDPFLMAVAIGAACDFLTPIGHQCNTLVMGPGGYRFGDYWKLGLPLSVIVIVLAVPLITLVWPL
ncbi:SLC13 family permease [Aquibium carbonis]|uniref:SLC13 family permease n=1 Tax=Aquibium carbonis TaxID=2495581 RepID=A0A3R9YE97_9HYPH|nr:SLC13 family permease [Aquibium carbonis]